MPLRFIQFQMTLFRSTRHRCAIIFLCLFFSLITKISSRICLCVIWCSCNAISTRLPTQNEIWPNNCPFITHTQMCTMRIYDSNFRSGAPVFDLVALWSPQLLAHTHTGNIIDRRTIRCNYEPCQIRIFTQSAAIKIAATHSESWLNSCGCHSGDNRQQLARSLLSQRILNMGACAVCANICIVLILWHEYEGTYRFSGSGTNEREWTRRRDTVQPDNNQ